jgi:hypothetical protein
MLTLLHTLLFFVLLKPCELFPSQVTALIFTLLTFEKLYWNVFIRFSVFFLQVTISVLRTVKKKYKKVLKNFPGWKVQVRSWQITFHTLISLFWFLLLYSQTKTGIVWLDCREFLSLLPRRAKKEIMVVVAWDNFTCSVATL